MSLNSVKYSNTLTVKCHIILSEDRASQEVRQMGYSAPDPMYAGGPNRRILCLIFILVYLFVQFSFWKTGPPKFHCSCSPESCERHRFKQQLDKIEDATEKSDNPVRVGSLLTELLRPRNLT
jgi:hypothetical protein